MEGYLASLTSVNAPLLVVQGVGRDKRPEEFSLKKRTATNQRKLSISVQDVKYGVQLDIHRELDDVNDTVVGELVEILERQNVRNRAWWPSLLQNDKFKNSNSSWFNILYADEHFDSAVNGSQSALTPYDKNSDFYNTMLPLEWMDKYYSRIPIGFVSIYELTEDEEYDAILINEILRMKKQFDATLTKFFCLIYTEGPVKDDRGSKIRIKTGMADSNSLFFVTKVQSEVTIRDRAIFISKLLTILKRHSVDFFNNQIRKLKVREAKDAAYPERLFTMRFMIKFSIFELFKGLSEYSTNLILRTHSKLMKLLEETSSTKTLFQIRNWLDTFCIHIVRAHIVMGSYSKAYQKFRSHIKSVITIIGQDNNWISLQYTWFAQLLENMGTDLITLDHMFIPDAKSSNVKDDEKLRHPGLLYLESVKYRTKSLKKGDNRLLLLSGALDMFSSADHTKFNRIESMIYIRIGDIYYEDENYSMAINNFKTGLSSYSNWGVISVYIIERLLFCYKKLNNVNESWALFFKMHLVSEFTITNIYRTTLGTNVQKSLKSFENKILHLRNDLVALKPFEEAVNLKNEIFTVHVIAQKYQNVINDGVTFQVQVKKFDLPMVESLLIDELIIKIEGLEQIVIKGKNGDFVGKLHKLKLDINRSNSFEATMNLSKNNEVIIQVHIDGIETGEFVINEAYIKGRLDDIKFEDTISIFPCPLDSIQYWYKNKAETGINLTPNNPLDKIELVKDSNTFEILPRIPSIECSLKYDEVGYNGQVFPVRVHFKNIDDISKIRTQLQAFGSLNDKEIEFDWGKDVDRVKTSEVLEPGDSFETVLWANLPQVNGLPLAKGQPNCVIELNIKYLLVEGGVVDVKKEIRFNVIELFETKRKITPVEHLGIPNVFAKSSLKVSRSWDFDIDVTNLGFNPIKIKNLKVGIMSLPETDVKYTIADVEKDALIDYSKSHGFKFNVLISSITNLRVIPVELRLILQYESVSKKNCEYAIDVFNGKLPHNEPRILVKYESEDNGNLKVEYVLENPTDSIIQYQTNFTNDNREVSLVGNYSKTMRLTLLPYLTERVTFIYSGFDHSKETKLPEFSVYDKQRQMFVAIASLQAELRVEGGQLIFKSNIR